MAVGGSGVDTFRGNAGNDNLVGGGGNDHLYGGAGNDRLEGGTGNDELYGENGNDVIIGGEGDDYIDGGNGNNTLDGGAGIDTLRTGTGVTTLSGGAESDIITIWSVDNGLTDTMLFLTRGDGGANGDQISGDIGYLVDGDLRFQFAKAQFNTNGNNFDKVVADNGTIPGGASGNAADGADLVLYNNGGAGLTTATAVNHYFYNHYYEANDVGAFLANYDNTTGITSIWYDHDAYSSASGSELAAPVLLAQITGYSAAFAQLGNDFSLL